MLAGLLLSASNASRVERKIVVTHGRLGGPRWASAEVGWYPCGSPGGPSAAVLLVGVVDDGANGVVPTGPIGEALVLDDARTAPYPGLPGI